MTATLRGAELTGRLLRDGVATVSTSLDHRSGTLPTLAADIACGFTAGWHAAPMSRRRARAARAVTLRARRPASSSACGASPAPQPPTGIDGLTIPTPSPAPADFVARRRQPVVPAGARHPLDLRPLRDHRVRDAHGHGAARPASVDGVDTTAVRWEVRRPGRPSVDARRALVRRGHRRQRLVVRPAGDPHRTPRRPAGDPLLGGGPPRCRGRSRGVAPRPGSATATPTATSPAWSRAARPWPRVDASVALPSRTYRGTVATHDLSPLEPTRQVQSFYARGHRPRRAADHARRSASSCRWSAYAAR